MHRPVPSRRHFTKKALINIDIPGLDIKIPIISPLIDPILRIGPANGSGDNGAGTSPSTTAAPATTTAAPTTYNPTPTTSPSNPDTGNNPGDSGPDSGNPNSGGSGSDSGNPNSGGSGSGDSGSGGSTPEYPASPGSGDSGSSGNSSGSNVPGAAGPNPSPTSGNSNESQPDGSPTTTTAKSPNDGAESDGGLSGSSSVGSIPNFAAADFNPTPVINAGGDPAVLATTGLFTTTIFSDGKPIATQTIGFTSLVTAGASYTGTSRTGVYTSTLSDGTVVTRTGSPSPSDTATGAPNNGGNRGLSAGAIAGIVIGIVILLLLLLLLFLRKRSMNRRSERRNDWWTRRGDTDPMWVDAVGVYTPRPSSSGTLSPTSSFGTTYDRGAQTSRYSFGSSVDQPQLPPMAEIRDSPSPEMVYLSNQTSATLRTSPRSSAALLVRVDSANKPQAVPQPALGTYYDEADRRYSVQSIRTTSSDPYSQRLVIHSPTLSDHLTSMSVRPFTPTETFAFPKPPQDSQERMSMISRMSVISRRQSEIRRSQPPSAFPFQSKTVAAVDPFSDPSMFLPIETVRRPFIPTLHDEIDVAIGDQVRVTMLFDDGWALVEKVDAGGQGLIPVDCFREPGQDLPAFLAAKRVSSYARVSVAGSVEQGVAY